MPPSSSASSERGLEVDVHIGEGGSFLPEQVTKAPHSNHEGRKEDLSNDKLLTRS
jgi:hypothetical protein